MLKSDAENELVRIIQNRVSPMDPIPTDLKPRLQSPEDIRAVVFDVYGTMLISGSGDISLARREEHNVHLQETLQECGYSLIQEEAPDLAEFFHNLIESNRNQAIQNGIDFPEIDIREIWTTFLNTGINEGWLKGNTSRNILSIEYECRVNPVYPMPGIEEVITFLNEHHFAKGIVSNAQFFTPLLFPALFGKSLRELGFEENLQIWSFAEGQGKPSTNLFQHLAEALQPFNITPDQTLYIGNDLRNDIWPAASCGFITALFAGDQRSLRLRENDPDVKAVTPDIILTHWDQLPDCLT